MLALVCRYRLHRAPDTHARGGEPSISTPPPTHTHPLCACARWPRVRAWSVQRAQRAGRGAWRGTDRAGAGQRGPVPAVPHQGVGLTVSPSTFVPELLAAPLHPHTPAPPAHLHPPHACAPRRQSSEPTLLLAHASVLHAPIPHPHLLIEHPRIPPPPVLYRQLHLSQPDSFSPSALCAASSNVDPQHCRLSIIYRIEAWGIHRVCRRGRGHNA